MVATYAGTSNYNSTSSSPVNFSIAQRALHVTATGQNKVYDGTTTAAITFGDDRVAGDTLTIAYGSATFLDKNVNNAIAISVLGVTMSGSFGIELHTGEYDCQHIGQYHATGDFRKLHRRQ